ncbi:MAG TPA: GlmU family protein [Bacteroidia bacterium]|nr:glucose-1-phosphate thymidylyltransferase [Sphingobacteriales bacterium]HPD65105.1 GlmU family protein [Bacteroidia bacterium]HRS58734.1 GlmU family protein [Bacteroidia bacterium]HRU67932.1 GlmU family protein [Bacteroidia bacterium]
MANYILFDDHQVWENLLPLTYTRPVSEIRTGILTIAEKWNYYLNTSVSKLTEDYLSRKFPTKISGDDIYINSSILPDNELVEAIHNLKPGEVLLSKNEWLASYGHPKTFFNQHNQSEKKIFSGNYQAIRHLWDIFLLNGKEINRDFGILTKGKSSVTLSSSNRIFGQHPVFAEEGASAECAIFNTTFGPIYLGKHSLVMEGSIIQGPFSLGESSQVKLAAKIYPGSTIGPQCRVGGELNNVVFLGFSNKAHDGFLGNAVIGEWCNIGADSNNSNLKNTYENVKVWNYSHKSFMDSGLQFCGLFMGDHSKCGINTMFNTGTSVGVSANIFGAGFPRTFIPSFVWGGAAGFTTYKPEKAFQSMAAVMSRRNCELSELDKSILSHIFEITKEFRN